MARLIKAVARCGLRFESGLPRGAKERVGVYMYRVCIRVKQGATGTETKGEEERERVKERPEGMENKRVEHIRWA